MSIIEDDEKEKDDEHPLTRVGGAIAIAFGNAVANTLCSA
jgi:hypothetical protein